MANRPPGIIGLTAFFWFGTTMAGLSFLALLLPRTFLSSVWRLNPEAHASLLALGSWSIALMATVSLACAATATGLWRGAEWGRRLAIGVLVVNLLGDAGNALVRGDPRTLIGLPIGGALIAYLLTARVRGYFKADA